MSAMRGVGGKEGPSTSRCFRVINFMPSAFEAECTNFVRNVENSGAMRQNVTFYDIFLIKAKTVLSLIKSVQIDEYVDIYQSDPCYISSGLNVKPIHNRLAGLTVILRIQRSGMLCAFYLSCFSVVAFSLTLAPIPQKNSSIFTTEDFFCEGCRVFFIFFHQGWTDLTHDIKCIDKFDILTNYPSAWHTRKNPFSVLSCQLAVCDPDLARSPPSPRLLHHTPANFKGHLPRLRLVYHSTAWKVYGDCCSNELSRLSPYFSRFCKKLMIGCVNSPRQPDKARMRDDSTFHITSLFRNLWRSLIPWDWTVAYSWGFCNPLPPTGSRTQST